MGNCCTPNEISKQEAQQEITGLGNNYDFDPKNLNECIRPELSDREREQINPFSDGYFKAYNQLRRNPKNYTHIAEEFGLSDMFDKATEAEAASPTKEFYDLAKEKVIEMFNGQKDKKDIKEELKKFPQFKDYDLDIYFGRIDYQPKSEKLEEFMNFCRRGVCDIINRYSEDEDLLSRKAEYSTFVCIIDEIKTLVNTVMIVFNKNK
ncbi:MAG: hypothetical protein MJ252_03525 [archaeon]|nr:hypothetical protein [archaeon]